MIWFAVGALALAGLACLFVAAWWLRGKPAIAGAVLLLAAVGLAWTQVTRDPETKPLDPHPDSNFEIVALGDSFISGEGAQRYFPGTDDVRTNLCHRATTAHPYLAAERMEASLTFVACSGARTQDVTGLGADGRPVPGQYPASDPAVFGGRPQLEVLREVADPDLVLISIGGNDAGFAEIGSQCAAPGRPECLRSASHWLRRLETVVHPQLVQTFESVREAAGDAIVFAFTYPNPIGPEYCRDIALSPAEMSFVRDVFSPRLGEIVTSAATIARVRTIDLARAVDGHRFCEEPLGKTAVNFIELGRSRGSTVELSLRGLGSLGRGTLHPNRLGHEMIASRVVGELEAARAGRPKPLPPAPADREPPPFTPEELGSAGGPQPFPPGTACRGPRIETVTRTSADTETREVSLSAVRPRSTVCFRTYRAEWKAARVGTDGTARVPVDVSRAGAASINEILAEQPDGSWRKLVVSRLGGADEVEPPAEPSKLGLYVLLAVVAIGLGLTFGLRWASLRRRDAAAARP